MHKIWPFTPSEHTLGSLSGLAVIALGVPAPVPLLALGALGGPGCGAVCTPVMPSVRIVGLEDLPGPLPSDGTVTCRGCWLA